MIQRHAFVSLLFFGLVVGSTVIAQDSIAFRSEVEVAGRRALPMSANRPLVWNARAIP